ncbi:FAD-binding oxidoreductase [Aureimonas fodinaquatilis]|uniref:FAD-binding oxidoreductase n=1 Tax=Aureimonas fodinaquatilis TaxID=2565783 RepID=A0A5B0DWA7_9HYPH|nr:FAD-binding oxidoreductase [Aureimonas fodinaquatilis]KAA0970776.1 FAD-binding oxidoreductase [Aureimonas fodinaquatilis]
MTQEARADIVVIGAGVVGLMAALALSATGRTVTIVEKNAPARGASFGNAGILAFSEIMPLASPGIIRQAPKWLLDPLGPLSIRPSYAHRIAPWLWRFWQASRPQAYGKIMQAQAALMQLSRQEMQRASASAELGQHIETTGTLDLYDGEAAFNAARRDWTAKEKAGIGFQVISGSEIETLQPGLAKRFLSHAVYDPTGQQVKSPYDFTMALASQFTAQGGSIVRDEVLKIEPQGTGARVICPGGRVLTANCVVLAAGAWSGKLAAALGDKLPLETERGYNTTLPPGAFDLKCQLYFNGHGFVATPVEGGVRIGGAVELGGLFLAPNYARSAAMLAKAQEFLPGLNPAGGTQWMGFRPSMADTLAVIGHSSASRSIVYAFGHGHLGLTQSAGTARLVRDLVLGSEPAIPMAAYSPARFKHHE